MYKLDTLTGLLVERPIVAFYSDASCRKKCPLNQMCFYNQLKNLSEISNCGVTCFLNVRA